MMASNASKLRKQVTMLAGRRFQEPTYHVLTEKVATNLQATACCNKPVIMSSKIITRVTENEEI